MKKLYLLAIALFLVHGIMQSQAPPEILHYNFNTTGSLVTNFASSPPPGTGTGTIIGTGLAQGVTNGQCGTALTGNGTSGSSSYLHSGWTTSLSGSWSIAFWTSSITPSSTLWYIFGDNTAGSFRCFTNGVAGANNWILRGTGMTDMLITGGATMTPAHNCFVYDATNSQGRMYLNGVLQGTVAQSGTATFSSSTGPFKVGAYATNNILNGYMDEFRVYSRALTGTEVSQISVGAPGSFTTNIASCGSYTSPSTSLVYTTTGVYSETFTGCGGTSTNNINLTVTPVPTVTITSTANNFCSGTTVTLSTTGNVTTYTWNSTGPNTSSLVVTPAAPSTYTLIAGNTSSCTVTETIALNVTSTPTVGLQSTQNAICAGTSITLTASGSSTYTWSTGSNATDIVEAPMSNTVYVVSSANGSCTGSSSVSINVTPVPTVIASSSSGSICSGQQVTLTATGANVFAWSTSATGTAVVVSPATSTSYVVYGISNGCTDTKTLTINVDPTPVVSVVSSTNSVCSGTMVTLTAGGASSYSWSTGSTANPATVAPTASGVYTVTGTTGSCSKSATVSISVQPGPAILAQSSFTSLCGGGPVSISALGAFSYTWNTGSTANPLSQTLTATTAFTVTGAGGNGCLGAASVTIPVFANPTVNIASSSPQICKGETATLTAGGAASYAWSNYTVTGNILVVTPPSNRNYTVTGTSTDGCKSTAVITQTVNECLGVNELPDSPGVLAYPNPGTGRFTIIAGANALSVVIYNSLGQQIDQLIPERGSAVADLRQHAAGIYFASISSGNKTAIIRLVKE